MSYNYLRALTALGCLMIAQSACHETPSAPPAITPSATRLVPVTPTRFTGTVGTPVDKPPSVLVEDDAGDPLPGITVTFELLHGGEYQVYAVPSNPAGIASIGTWTLSKVPGLNLMSAKLDPSDIVMFTATALAGPPARLTKVAGENNVAPAGSDLDVSPQVEVADLFGNKLRGIDVTFSVTSGGGSLNITKAVTDSLGLAAAGTWTLGPAGPQTLEAAVKGLPAAVFSATVFNPADVCAPTSGLVASATLQWTLSPASCPSVDGRLFVSIPVTLPDSSSAYVFRMTSKDFDTELELRDAGRNVIAFNNDGKDSGTNSEIKVLAAPGVYTLVAASHNPGGAGGYDLSIVKVPPDVQNCEDVFVTRGVTLTQRTTADDCNISSDFRGDRYRIYLTAGSSIAIDLQDKSYENPSFEIADSTGKLLATSIQNGYYLDSLVFAAPVDGVYLITVIGGPLSDSILTDYVLKIR